MKVRVRYGQYKGPKSLTTLKIRSRKMKELSSLRFFVIGSLFMVPVWLAGAINMVSKMNTEGGWPAGIATGLLLCMLFSFFYLYQSIMAARAEGKESGLKTGRIERIEPAVIPITDRGKYLPIGQILKFDLAQVLQTRDGQQKFLWMKRPDGNFTENRIYSLEPCDEIAGTEICSEDLLLVQCPNGTYKFIQLSSLKKPVGVID